MSSPDRRSAEAWAQTESSTAMRSEPSSAATIEEPSFTTIAMALVKLEFVLADPDLVPWFETGAFQF